MGLLDYVFPKKSPAEDLLRRPTSNAANEDDTLASVQAMYGLEPSAPEQTGVPGLRGGAPTNQPPPPARAPVQSPRAPQAPAPSSGPATQPQRGGSDDTLESPLRDLFTEASSMDPQLASLLERIEVVDAKELASELRAFVSSIGMDTESEA